MNKHMRQHNVPFFAVCLAVVIASLSVGKAMADYTTEQILRIGNEPAPGFSSKRIDAGELFAFTTLVHENMTIWTADGTQEPDEPVALIYDLQERNRLRIEVYHVRFESFAEAPTAGYGFLATNGYNRIIQDHDNSNAAFGHLAGGVYHGEQGDYGKMARLASFTRGNDVLFIQANFEYADYPEYENMLALFFGSVKLLDAGTPGEALREITAGGGETLLVPVDWSVEELDMSGEQALSSNYILTTGMEEYPNVHVMLRPVGLEVGRTLGAKMISEFTAQIESSPHVEFSGEPKMQTYHSDSGEANAYAYSRGWDTEAGAHLVSEFHIQENTDHDSISIVGLNSFDPRRNIESFDDEARDIIFKSWVTGTSAYAAALISLQKGSERFMEALDIRALGR